jgi:site-specific DNA-cytosine methylase
VKIRLQHVFSCEIEPAKQAYIERNFQPPLLFRDIRELGDNQARTAYGALVDVPNLPGSVDILVAGTSCVDYSNFNTKKKQMEEGGESGQTFQGMLKWIDRAKPPIVILENVVGAPWDKKVKLMESYGYAATWQRVDSKKYYIPHTRQRGYLVAIRKNAKNTVNQKRLNGWKATLKKLERPASASLDELMLSNDDPRVLRGRARLVQERSGGGAGDSRAGRTDWSKCEARHVRA